MKWLFVILAAVTLFSAVPAFADDFRCPNGNIVSTGDSIATVEAKCDPPANKSTEMTAPFNYSNSLHVGPGSYSEWTYTQGSTLEHILIFGSGWLVEVRTGGFVK
jgi:hypothetical protein